MIDLTSPVITGLILGLTAGLSPGPLLSLMLSETMRHGVKAGLLVSVAPLCTDLPIIALALAVHWLLPDRHTVQSILGLCGGCYLLWLGIHGILAAPPSLAQHVPGASALPSLGTAIVANLLNPNPYLFWITVGVPAMSELQNSSAAALFIGAFYLLLIGSKAAMALLTSRSISFLGARSFVLTLKFLSLTLCGYGLNFLLDAVDTWTRYVQLSS